MAISFPSRSVVYWIVRSVVVVGMAPVTTYNVSVPLLHPLTAPSNLPDCLIQFLACLGSHVSVVKRLCVYFRLTVSGHRLEVDVLGHNLGQDMNLTGWLVMI